MKSQATASIPETVASVPVEPSPDDLIGQPPPYLEDIAEFLNKMSVRSNAELDDFVLGIPNQIDRWVGFFSSKEDRHFRDTGYRKNKYEVSGANTWGLSQGAIALAHIYLLRGLDDRTKNVIYDVMRFKGQVEGRKFPAAVGIESRYGCNNTLSGAMKDCVKHVPVWAAIEDPEDLSEVLRPIDRILNLPPDISQSDNPATDLNAWLDRKEQEIYKSLPHYDRLFTERVWIRDSVAQGISDYDMHAQVTANNIRLNALQLLLHNMRQGFVRLDHLKSHIKLLQLNPETNDESDIWEYPPTKKYPKAPEGKTVDRFFHLTPLAVGVMRSGITPFRIELSELPQNGLDDYVTSTIRDLDSASKADYNGFKARMAVIMAIKGPNVDDPYYEVEKVDAPTAEEKRSQFFGLNTEKLVETASGIQRALAVIGLDVATDGWEQTADDEEIITQTVALPDGRTVDEVTAALEHQPAAVFEYDGRVIIIMEDDVEDAEFVVKLDHPVLG